MIGSSAIASAIPWLLRRAVDDLKAAAPPRHLVAPGGLDGRDRPGHGVLRFQMRNILNAISRYVEYDLRNAMFRHLLTLDAGFFGRNRTGDLMARLTNDLSAVRMVAGPAIMYLVNTIAGGIFALVFMLRISPQLTGIAVLPMVSAADRDGGAGSVAHPQAVRSGAGALRRDDDARAGEHQRSADRARVPAGSSRRARTSPRSMTSICVATWGWHGCTG